MYSWFCAGVLEGDWYDNIEFENEAEKFGQNNYKKWHNKFKKDGLI